MTDGNNHPNPRKATTDGQQAPEFPADATEEEKLHAAAARRKFLISVITGLGAPLALYYGLRALEFSPLVALVISVVPAIISVLYKLMKEGKPDAIAMFTIAMLVIGTVLTLVTGDPRFIFAKSGVVTGVIGLFVLATTPRRPAIFQGIMNLQPSAAGVAKWEANWANSPEIRQTMRGVNVIWGLGLLLDGIVRITFAYMLPIDSVPGLTLIQFIVAIVLIQIVSRRYGRWNLARKGLRLNRNDLVPLHQ
ncbi:VC0807 family protein [Amycolatopsis australiensis]|uniref:VC0807 family protein n=1 Tax=Amycolatopsis australiensis TaxID=546364 RepID=UPI0009304286|nr:VC0807 family protein [Amycolatopsis australiensis]